jgi:hypothetical protein
MNGGQASWLVGPKNTLEGGKFSMGVTRGHKSPTFSLFKKPYHRSSTFFYQLGTARNNTPKRDPTREKIRENFLLKNPSNTTN